jgi:uncharacterized protein DUF6200
MVAHATTATEQTELDKQAKSQLVVVELTGRRTPKQIKRLRKGRGKLLLDIDEVVRELTDAGTIKAGAPPVVIVVRETTSPSWLLDTVEDDEDADDR